MPELAEVVEKLGFGLSQIQQLFMGGGVYCADGAEMLIIGAVTRTVGEEWDFTPTQKGSVVTCVFIGVMLGNMLGGWLGDSYGRRLTILISFISVGVLSLVSACSFDFYSLCASRICVGIAIGVGVPAWNSLAGEIVSSKFVMLCNGSSSFFFVFGELYGGLLLMANDRSLKKVNWRWVVMMGSIPAFIFSSASYFYLYESPFYLALKGRKDQLTPILDSMRRLNRRPHVEIHDIVVTEEPEKVNYSAQLNLVLGQPYFGITAALCYSGFVLNFTYYGGLYAFPQIFSHLDTKTSAAMNLIAGGLWELPSIFLVIFVGSYHGRKPSLLASLLLNTIALICFGWASHTHHESGKSGDITPDSTSTTEIILHFAYYGIKLSNVYTFVLFYVYASEVYPTEARATGSAVFMAFSRIGSMTAPMAYEHMLVGTGSFKAFFYLSAGFCFVNLFCLLFLPETFGKRKSQRQSPISLSMKLDESGSGQIELADMPKS